MGTNGRQVDSADTMRSESMDNATTASVPPAISVVTFRWENMVVTNRNSGAPDRYRDINKYKVIYRFDSQLRIRFFAPVNIQYRISLPNIRNKSLPCKIESTKYL